MPIQNALTVDVEDYYQVSGFERDIDRQDWESYPSRVVENTRRILKLLATHNIQGTFFVLGWVADRFPGLVQEIDAAGHEIGSHSYWHQLIYNLTPEEFREDLRRSRDVLQEIIDKPVTAYRAPSFSITEKSKWALEILAEEGFTCDSSIFPIHHDRCGMPDAPRHPYVHQLKSGNLREFPVSVARIAGTNLPVSGGGYFRLFPYAMTSTLLRRVNTRDGHPFVFYIHPWEIDSEQPRLKASTLFLRFRHYVNLKSTEKKFERLLSTFSFARLDEVFDNYAVAKQFHASTSDKQRVNDVANSNYVESTLS